MKINPKFLQIIAGWLVGNVEAILIMCTPLLSPLPSMFAAMRALDKAGWQYANLIGGLIEMMGLATGAFVGLVESHNHRHPNSRINPVWGYGLFVFYFVVVESLILSSDPNIVSALLPGLTLVGSVIVGFRNLMRRADDRQAEAEAKQDSRAEAERQRQDAMFTLELEMKRREAEQRLTLRQTEAEQRLQIERQKAEAKLSTVNRKPVDKTGNHEPLTTGEQPVDSGDIVNKLLRVYSDNPKTSLRKAGDLVGLSHTGVDKMLDRLAVEGRIVRNGKVEVIG